MVRCRVSTLRLKALICWSTRAMVRIIAAVSESMDTGALKVMCRSRLFSAASVTESEAWKLAVMPFMATVPVLWRRNRSSICALAVMSPVPGPI